MSEKKSHNFIEKAFVWNCLPVLSVLLWGVTCLTDHLWYDEAYSAGLVALPWLQMIKITAVDAHSPFYYSLLKLVYLLSGSGTAFWALKLFSLAFMAGYMALGKYYVDKLFGRRVSVLFMAISMLLPIYCVQATNVRMYSMALFFMTLLGLTAYDLYRQATVKKWIVFCLSGIACVYCHTFAMIMAFWLFVLFLVALIVQKQKENIKYFFLSGITVAVVFAPWLFVTFRQMALRMKYDTGSATERATLLSFADYGKEWFSALETPILHVIVLGILVTLLLLPLGVIGMKRKKDLRPLIGLLAVVLTVLTGFLVSAFINNCFLGRYVFPGFGLVVLVMAIGMEQLGEKELLKASLQISVLLVLLVCFLSQYSSELSLEFDGGLEQYKSFVKENMTDEDAVIGPYAHTVFLNIYHPMLPYYIDSYKPYKLPFARVQELTNHEMLQSVRGNIWYICFEGSRPDSFLEQYDCERAFDFHYMYYDFVIYRLTPRL